MKNILWLLVALPILLITGCGKGNFSEKGQAASTSVFRYAIHTNPTSLDPGVVQDGDTLDLLQQVFEGLVGWGPNSEVVGLIAEKWDIKENGKVYAFTLKKGIKFHNGKEVTADDVKWSIERACSPGVNSETISAYLEDIQGLTEMKAGRAKEISGLKVEDPLHITITLTKPDVTFLGKLTYLVSAVVPKGDVPADKEIRDFKQMIGTGPYKVSQYEPNQLVVLEANKDYHGGAPKLERIERPVILNAETRLTKYKNGELDLVQIQRGDVEGLQADPKYKDQLKFFPRPAIWYLAMNQLVYPPFRDKRVRQAFAMCINREKIVNELMKGVNTKAETIVPPGIQGHRDKGKGLPYDPAAAKKLLAEAGFPDGKSMPPLEISHREGYPDIKLVAEAVASEINDSLGVKVTIRSMEWRAYLDKFNKKQQVFYHMRWAGDYLDPENFLSHMLATYGPENKLGYNNPKFDELCHKADGLLEWKDRLPLYAEAEDIALEDAAWVPIYFQRDVELQRPGLTGVRESLFGHLPHTTTTISR